MYFVVRLSFAQNRLMLVTNHFSAASHLPSLRKTQGILTPLIRVSAVEVLSRPSKCVSFLLLPQFLKSSSTLRFCLCSITPVSQCPVITLIKIFSEAFLRVSSTYLLQDSNAVFCLNSRFYIFLYFQLY